MAVDIVRDNLKLAATEAFADVLEDAIVGTIANFVLDALAEGMTPSQVRQTIRDAIKEQKLHNREYDEE